VPILHSFQDKELLRIGVRDLLGKSSIQETTAALSDLAQTVLERVVAAELAPLSDRHGWPELAAGGWPCRFAVLALGKLGAREMNFHSDLDLMLVYEGDGPTVAPARSCPERAESIDAIQFFTELAQRIIRTLSQIGPLGRLYQVDMRLRPTGKSGSLVLPVGELRRYYADGGAQLWERQALTRARVVVGEAGFADEVAGVVSEAAYGAAWRPEMVREIADMRERLEGSRPPRDLKRGPGGLADVEFLVQRWHLEHGLAVPALRATNTWAALAAARDAGLLGADEHRDLAEGYGFLLRVQNRLRIVHNRTLDAVPEDEAEVEKLARRLGLESGARFLSELEGHRRRVRERYRDGMGLR
jgi:glutamate-ammonia-ligase adenylyltransferase